MQLSAKTEYENRWFVRPTVGAIKATCHGNTYRTGMHHHNNGNVVGATITKNMLNATVQSQQTRHVELEYTKNGYEYSCSCNDLFLEYGTCEHIVAVLLYLKDNFAEMLEEEASRPDAVKYIIARVRSEEALEFLATHMSMNPHVKDAFVKKFHLENVHPPRDYAAQLGRMYSRARKQHNPDRLDFGPIFTEARGRQERGEIPEATKMYREMSKTVRENMGSVDDKDGYYADCCIESLENMVDSIVREDPSHGDKQFHIEHTFNEFLKLEDDRIMQHYLNALDTVCTDGEDLVFLEGLLAPHLNDPIWTGSRRIGRNMLGLPSRHVQDLSAARARLAGVVRMQARVLEETGRADKARLLLERHASTSKDLCVRYLHLLKDADPEMASREAQKAAGEFPNDTHVMDAVLALLPKGSKEHAAFLKKLFVLTGDMDYIRRLKQHSADWDADIGELLAAIARSSPEKAVEICLNEGMRGKAMDMLESAGGVTTFYKFHAKLVKKEPERYVAAYCRAVEKFAKGNSGKDHYQRVAGHLIKIRETPGSDDEYNKTVKRITRKGAAKRHLGVLLGSA